MIWLTKVMELILGTHPNMTVIPPLFFFGTEVSSTPLRVDSATVSLVFRFVMGGRGTMVLERTNEAANVAAAYTTLCREEGSAAGVFFFRHVVDEVAFFQVDLALRFLVEEGSDNGAATAIDGVIADNISWQLL